MYTRKFICNCCVRGRETKFEETNFKMGPFKIDWICGELSRILGPSVSGPCFRLSLLEKLSIVN